MTNRMIGMNVDEVEDLGRFLQGQGGELRSMVQRIDWLIGRTYWAGPTGERFKHQWWPEHRARLLDATERLEGLSRSAANNASEQRRISGTAGSGGPSGGGLSAPVRLANGVTLPSVRTWQEFGSTMALIKDVGDTAAVVAPWAHAHFHLFGGVRDSLEFGLQHASNTATFGPWSAVGVGFDVAGYGIEYSERGAYDAATISAGVDVVAGVALAKVPFGAPVWKLSTGVTAWAVTEIDRRYDTSGAFIDSVVARTGAVPDYSGPTGLFRYLGDGFKNAVSPRAWGFR